MVFNQLWKGLPNLVQYSLIIARSALYFLCVRGPARTLVCCLVVTDFVKLTLSSGRVTTLLPLGVLTEIFKYCVFSLFLDQFHQRFTLHICGLRGPENGHISLFLDQFHQRLRLHIGGLRGPENGHISLFFDQSHQRLSLHICGLSGPEKGSVLISGAPRPCSAACCLVKCFCFILMT